MTSADAVPDLTAAADVLGRAADHLKQLVGAANGPGDGPVIRWHAEGGSVVWARETGFPDGDDVVRVANDCTGPEAEFIATVDPQAVAALAPALRLAETWARLEPGQPCEDSPDCGHPGCWMVADLLEFARLVLRKEETGG